MKVSQKETVAELCLEQCFTIEAMSTRVA